MTILFSLLILVTFNGVPARCLVDTGASHTVISQELAGQVPGLTPALMTTQLVTASGAPMTGAVHVVPTANTEYFRWRDALVVVVPSSALAQGWSCILGLNLLAQQPVLFDWRNAEIRPVAPEVVAAPSDV